MLDEENLWYYDDGQLIDLTPNQAKMLAVLIENKGKVVPTKEIVSKMFKDDTNINIYKNSIRIIASRLNKRIGFSLKIKAKKGKGYYIELYISKERNKKC